MLELGIDESTFRPLTFFKTSKPGIGMKPLLSFSGAIFDSIPNYQLFKSMFLDFFRGETVDSINVEGLQYMIHFSAPESTEQNPTPTIHMRVHLIKTLKSGQKLPRVEVEEMGPRIDFKIRRVQEPDEAMMKEALKKPRALEVYPHFRYRCTLMMLITSRLGPRRTSKRTSSVTRSVVYTPASKTLARCSRGR